MKRQCPLLILRQTPMASSTCVGLPSSSVRQPAHEKERLRLEAICNPRQYAYLIGGDATARRMD